MTDLVLIQAGRAHQVIANTTKAAHCYKLHDGESAPRAIFPQLVIDAMVEVESGSVREGYAWDGSQFVAPAPPSVDLPTYAAAKRHEIETGGIVVGGVAVATDRASQAMLTGAVVNAQINSGLTIKWKTPAGFVTLDAAQIVAIGTAVATHVEACFAKEADVVALIAVGDIETAAEIDAAFAELE